MGGVMPSGDESGRGMVVTGSDATGSGMVSFFQRWCQDALSLLAAARSAVSRNAAMRGWGACGRGC
jgi:hypothetical protein